MSTVAVVAVAEPAHVPPRIKLTVTDTGTPALTSATVVRSNGDGTTSVVRTPFGSQMPLPSGTARVAVLYDYEAPSGQAVTYSSVETPGSVSSAVTLTTGGVVLVHVARPVLSQAVQVQTWGERTRAARRGVFTTMGRTDPIVVTEGVRGAAEFTLTLVTTTLAAADGLEALIEDGGVLWASVPATSPWGVSSMYLSVGDVGVARAVRIVTDQTRVWTLPCTVVARPAGANEPEWSYDDVKATYATYNALKAAVASYNVLAAG